MLDASARWPAVRLGLAAGVLALALWGRRPVAATVLVLPEPATTAPATTAPRDPRVAPALLATLTADDVARGVQALAAGEGPGLAPAQAEALLPLAESGLQARREVDRLQARRRTARQALRQSGLDLLSAWSEPGLPPQDRP